MSMGETHLGVDKIQMYKWNVKDDSGRLVMIDKNRVEIAPEYQREPNHKRVLRMAGSWSWVAFGAITVGNRDERYWVIDGQHRVLAARKRSDITVLPCVVFDLIDVQTEAAGFVRSNTMRRPMEFAQRHKALLVAGDETALSIQELCSRYGVSIPPPGLRSDRLEPASLTCLSALNVMYAEDPSLAERTLAICADLARADSVSISRMLLTGVRQLAREIEGCFSDKRFMSRVYSAGAAALLAAARKHSAMTGSGGEKVHGLGMLNEINKGLQRKYRARERS